MTHHVFDSCWAVCPTANGGVVLFGRRSRPSRLVAARITVIVLLFYLLVHNALKNRLLYKYNITSRALIKQRATTKSINMSTVRTQRRNSCRYLVRVDGTRGIHHVSPCVNDSAVSSHRQLPRPGNSNILHEHPRGCTPREEPPYRPTRVYVHPNRLTV